MKLQLEYPEQKSKFLNTTLVVLISFYIILELFQGEVTLFGKLSLCLFIYLLLELLWYTGKTLPIRSIFSVMMALQMLVGPYFSFYWFGKYQFIYTMSGTPIDYYNYALPAMLALIFGLRLNSRESHETINTDKLKLLFKHQKSLPYSFIFIGLVFTFFENIQGTEYAFLFVLLACLKYVGLFILIVSQDKLPTKEIFVVFGLLIFKSGQQGMFHDLMTWSIFLGIIISLRYPFSYRSKVFGFLGLLILAFLIQTIKETYRVAISSGEEGVAGVENSFQQVQSSKGIFSKENVGFSMVRINQGWILSRALKQVPRSEKHTNGLLTKKYLEAAILPRLLAPDKLNAGSKEYFTRYTGVELAKQTSMGLGIFADAYIEFGYVGGWIWLFLYGLMFNIFLKLLHKHSTAYPYLFLFVPLMFIYPIRPDCETQTVLGHLFKSAFLVYLLHLFIKHKYLIRSRYIIARSI